MMERKAFVSLARSDQSHKERAIRRSVLILIAALCIPARLAGQALGDPGPRRVGWRDVTFNDVIYGQGTISGRTAYLQGIVLDGSGGGVLTRTVAVVLQP